MADFLDPTRLGGRILVVDDEPAQARALAELIGADHEGSVWIDSAPKALELVAFGSFELVLTDLHMPRVDGLELLRALEDFDPDLPVILLVESGEAEAAVEALRARAFDLLWKPVEAESVRAAVERGLHARARAVPQRAQELEQRERLERRSALLSVLFEQGSDGVLTWDARGRLVDISPSALALTGVSLERVLEGGTGELFEREPFGGRIDELIPDLVEQLSATPGTRVSREVVVRTCEGPAPARLVFDLCELPAREGGGPPVRWVMGLLQPRHGHLRERLRRADSLSSAAMIAVVSAHEIKNDLGPLLTYLSLLEEMGPSDADLRELLDAAKASIRRAGQLVERILAPLQPDRPHRRDIDVGEVVRSSVNFVKRSTRERASIEVVIADDLPRVRARPDDVHQIVMNLVRNAFDAVALVRRDGGSVVDPRAPAIRVELRAEPERGQLLLEVSDQGPGIEPAEQGRVFEPFYTTKGTGGTGLGLTVVRDLVRDLGGDLHIVSTPTVIGTCVQVWLPARGAAASAGL